MVIVAVILLSGLNWGYPTSVPKQNIDVLYKTCAAVSRAAVEIVYLCVRVVDIPLPEDV